MVDCRDQPCGASAVTHAYALQGFDTAAVLADAESCSSGVSDMSEMTCTSVMRSSMFSPHECDTKVPPWMTGDCACCLPVNVTF